jgi:hypothetical protein
MTLLTSHAACGKSWKQRGNRTGHCSACHHTFEGITLFDMHRRGGVCADPAVMTVGGLPLVFDGTHGDGAWSADPSILNAAFRGRETVEDTRSTRNASEAANRQNWTQTEAVLP